MVVYEVNLRIDHAVVEEFRQWLQDHIKEMLTLPGFLSAQWYEVETQDDDRASWKVDYRLVDRAALQNYLDHNAAHMRAQGLERFEKRFTVERRILQPIRKFDTSHPAAGENPR